MKHCRFENRLTGQAHVLSGFQERITASSADELESAFARVEVAQKNGAWIALLLEYELGEWLEPALLKTIPDYQHSAEKTPRLTALVFDCMHLEAPWGSDNTDQSCVLSIRPELSKAQY